MQINISLSKKEKKHYFLYLLGMLLLAVLILSVIILRKYNSPFAVVNYDSIYNLKEKADFDQAQDYIILTMDSTFSKIDKLNPENITPSKKREIEKGIDEIKNSLQNGKVVDKRKEGYSRIAKFYELYYSDKKKIQALETDIKLIEGMIERCNNDVEAKRKRIGQ